MTAPRDHRTYPVRTRPVFDPRTGDVAVGTEPESIEIAVESPWIRRLTKRYPDGRITRCVYDCADELAVYRTPEPASEVDGSTAPRSANTGRLADTRCPRWLQQAAFVVQITLNVVMLDDGMDLVGSGQLSGDHFPTRVTGSGNGFGDDDPIHCHEIRAAAGTGGR